MTTPVHALVPAFDDRPVLASAPLKAVHAREELSHVGDPTWDLGPAVFRENARRCHVTACTSACSSTSTARSRRCGAAASRSRAAKTA